MELGALLLLTALAWLWMDSLQVREIAVRCAREACAAEDLLFLDDTVAIASLKLARDDAGHVRLQRAYDFEYSDTGNNRIKGGIVMLGKRMVLLNVGWRNLRSATDPSI